MARPKKQLEPAPKPPSVFDDGAFALRRTFQNDQGYQVPIVEPDEAREVLQRIASGKPRDGDFYLLAGIDGRLGTYDEDIAELRSEILMNTLSDVLGPDFKADTLSQIATNKPAPLTREAMAAERAHDIFTTIHALEGTLKKKTLIARELWRRGYTLREMLDAGLNRGVVTDARTVVRSEYLKRSEKIPERMAITAPGQWKRGSDKRHSSGELALEAAEASRVLSQCVDLIAEPKKPRKRRGYTNTHEGIESRAYVGTYDDGSSDEGETE